MIGVVVYHYRMTFKGCDALVNGGIQIGGVVLLSFCWLVPGFMGVNGIKTDSNLLIRFNF